MDIIHSGIGKCCRIDTELESATAWPPQPLRAMAMFHPVYGLHQASRHPSCSWAGTLEYLHAARDLSTQTSTATSDPNCDVNPSCDINPNLRRQPQLRLSSPTPRQPQSAVLAQRRQLHRPDSNANPNCHNRPTPGI